MPGPVGQYPASCGASLARNSLPRRGDDGPGAPFVQQTLAPSEPPSSGRRGHSPQPPHRQIWILRRQAGLRPVRVDRPRARGRSGHPPCQAASGPRATAPGPSRGSPQFAHGKRNFSVRPASHTLLTRRRLTRAPEDLHHRHAASGHGMPAGSLRSVQESFEDLTEVPFEEFTSRRVGLRSGSAISCPARA